MKMASSSYNNRTQEGDDQEDESQVDVGSISAQVSSSTTHQSIPLHLTCGYT